MKVHLGALKHGVSAEDAIQAAEWSLWIEPLDDDGPPDRELRLGFNTAGRSYFGGPSEATARATVDRPTPRSRAT